VITGVVNVNREAIIRLVVYGTTGQTSEIEAVIDTGFTGFLTLPSSLILALGLTWRGQAQALLGDGSLHQFDVYGATVIRDGQMRIVETDAADTMPLIGMGLLYGYDLHIQTVEGGTVTIAALPVQ
jgi:clan AA aspartic protease